MSKRKAVDSPQESSEEDPDEFIVSSPSNFGSMMSSLGPWEREDYERFLREAPEDFGLTREEVDALTPEEIDEMYKMKKKHSMKNRLSRSFDSIQKISNVSKNPMKIVEKVKNVYQNAKRNRGKSRK